MDGEKGGRVRRGVVLLIPLLLGLLLAGCAARQRAPVEQALTAQVRPPFPPTEQSPLPTPTPIPTPTPTPIPAPPIGEGEVFVGNSTRGHPITAHVFGDGPQRVAFVGAIHGGYEWNTALLAYQAIDHFAANPQLVPAGVTLYIIPVANPDGLKLVTGGTGRFTPADVAARTAPGRFNGHGVDLNRNWECAWEPTGFWGGTRVDAGRAPMSEAETRALARFLSEPPMDAVIFWHSSMGAVFAGGCGERDAPSDRLAATYAEASRYPWRRAFTSYPVTGDASDWLALQGVPAIVVELWSRRRLDWEQNLAGMAAALELVAAPGPIEVEE